MIVRMTATHGSWCNAVTWPTKCPACQASVYFFKCDCGSKVFFDELGSPWPIHDCERSWSKNLIRSRDGSGGITVEITDGITVRRPPETFSVDAGVITKAKRRKKKSEQDPIISVKPDGSTEKVTVVGTLREKKVEVDVIKSIKLSNATSMVMASLGPLAKGKWGKVTLFEPSASQNIFHSYTFYVPSKFLYDVKNNKGITVLAEISSLSIPGIGEVWCCEEYDVLG